MKALLVAVAALVCACATGRQSLGDVSFRPYNAPLATPVTFSVQQGRLLSPNVDVVVGPDGCVRGTVLSGAVVLCKRGTAPTSDKPGDVVETWSGTGADFTIELMDGGKKMRMDGFLRPTVRQEIPMHATVPLGEGPQWDELRKHPVLLAIAAALAGVSGEPAQ